jgi:hypothetical protein
VPLLAREEEEALRFRLDFYLRFQDWRNTVNNTALIADFLPFLRGIGITGYMVTLS